MNEAAFVGTVDRKLLETIAEHAATLGMSPQDVGLHAGKRVRPRLVHACAESLSLAPELAVPWATLVELIHVASLVHDDVIDDATLRRGRPSLRARDGNRRAVLGGDLFISAAWLAASRDLPSEATAILARAMIAMATAEWLERELLWNPDASLSCYLRIIDGKTAALFAAAAEGTAALAAAPPTTRTAFARCGRALGRAFQIQDDVRDYERTRQTPDKDWMKDLREGIVTLPLIIALRHGGLDARAVRRYLVARGRLELDPRASDALLFESQALARSARIARRLIRRGFAGLESPLPTHAIRELAMTACGFPPSPGAAVDAGLPMTHRRPPRVSAR